jgi:hypothetical protein
MSLMFTAMLMLMRIAATLVLLHTQRDALHTRCALHITVAHRRCCEHSRPVACLSRRHTTLRVLIPRALHPCCWDTHHPRCDCARACRGAKVTGYGIAVRSDGA